MKKFLLAVMAVVLTACSTTNIPNYRALANKVVPTNLELVGTIINPFSGTSEVKAYCSGVAVSPTRIITAGHCIEAAKEYNSPALRELLVDGKIQVRLQDGRVVLAAILVSQFGEKDVKNSRDIAVLEVLDPVLTPATIGDSDEVRVGDQVAIVGNSFGELKHSFTIGVVSYVNRELAVGNFIQTDAVSAGGNSGGPVFNMDGELIGILVRGGGGISLLIPINDALEHIHHKAP